MGDKSLLQMEEPPRPSGPSAGGFNLNKFRLEVQARVASARAEEEGTSMAKARYMHGPAQPRLADLAPLPKHATAAINMDARMQGRSGDEAQGGVASRAKQRQTAVSSVLSEPTPDSSKSAAARGRRARSSLEIVRAPHSFGHVGEDAGEKAYVIPEKWYSLSQHSAQIGADVWRHREQSHAPLAPTRPSRNPYSMPPSRVNKFHDIAPNPRLVEDLETKRKRRTQHTKAKDGDEEGASSRGGRSPPKAGIPLFGYMRKCNNPFTEGWKVATFKPAREKLVPYLCIVRKFWKDRGYGFLDYRGSQVFVHVNDIRVQGGVLQEGQRVVCEIYPHANKGMQARNVVLDTPDSVMKPHGMSDEEYNDILARRKYDEELRMLFGTGFWSYPKSAETISPELGGNGFDYIPFEKSVSMERKTTITNPLTDEQAAKMKPPPLKVDGDGLVSLEDKLARRPWLTKFLQESPARRPKSLPQCHSYFTSPVVSSVEETRQPRHRYSVHEAALACPSTLRKETLSALGPPQPHRGLGQSISEGEDSRDSSFAGNRTVG